MKQIDIIIFCLLFYLVNNDFPGGKVINTCGKVGYSEPSEEECKEIGEICCFVHLKNTPSGEKKFCASAPSKITLDDVKEDIEANTGFQLYKLVCNNSNFIKNSIIISLLFLFELI